MILEQKKRLFCPEFFFSAYYFLFQLIKPILIRFSSASTVILLQTAVLIVLLSISSNKWKLNSQNTGTVVMTIFAVLLLFVLDGAFRPNKMLWDYFYLFLIYGMIPMALLINVNDYDTLLYWWTWLAVIMGAMYIFDPFKGYQWMGGYMPFGFEAMLPAFAGVCVVLFRYHKKIVIPLMIVFFVETVLFGNKGAIISEVAVFILTFCFSDKSINVRKLVAVALFGVMVIVFRMGILSAFLSVASSLGIRSYALVTIAESLQSSDVFFIGRDSLWSDVIQIILQRPMTGYGIGWLEGEIGNYAHNFFLDIICTFGVLFAILIVLFILSMLRKTIKANNVSFRYFSLLMLVLWFFPLLFSLTFWKVLAFWTFLCILLLYKPKRISKEHTDMASVSKL